MGGEGEERMSGRRGRGEDEWEERMSGRRGRGEDGREERVGQETE